MGEEQKSFWGEAKFEPGEADVAYFVEIIRTTTKNYGKDRALKIATSAMTAITAFVVYENGPKEALALLDRLRSEVIDG